MTSVQQRKKDESNQPKLADTVEVKSSKGFRWMAVLLFLVSCGGIAYFINSNHMENLSNAMYSMSGKGTASFDLNFPISEIESLRFESIVIGDTESRTIANGDSVKLHVKGLLTTGKEFWATGNPITESSFDTRIGVGQLIAGFDQGVVGMHIGELRRIYIPWTMGYGAGGMPPAIPAKADLIFEVQLAAFNN